MHAELEATARLPCEDALVMRNVRVGGRRTTVRLEQTYWDALDEVSRQARMSRDALCGMVYDAGGGKRLTANLRLFLLNYYRRPSAAALGQVVAATPPPSR